MNEDTETPGPLNAVGDEALEARIVAWVLGDASVFEASELERLCAERPELLVFHRRMLALHGLLADAETGGPDPAWQLPPEKRAKLDELCFSRNEETPVKPASPGAGKRRVPVRVYIMRVAACVLLPVIGMASYVIYAICFPDSIFSRPIVRRTIIQNIQEPSIDFLPPSGASGGGFGGGVAMARSERLPELRGGIDIIGGTKFKLNITPSSSAAAPQVSNDIAPPRPDEGRADDSRRSPRAVVDEEESVSSAPAAPPPTVVMAPSASAALADAKPMEAAAPKSEVTRGLRAGDVAVNRANTDSLLADRKNKKTDAFADSGVVTQPEPPAGSSAARYQQSSLDGDGIVADKSTLTRAESTSTLSGVNSYTGASHISAGTLGVDGRSKTAADLPKAAPERSKHAEKQRELEGEAGEKRKELAAIVRAKSIAYVGKDTRTDAQRTATESVRILAAMDEGAANSDPYSTFSLHVSDASFKLAKAALDRGSRPDPSTVRPEEFYNAFDYGDPAPAAGEPVACTLEQAAHPVLPQRNLVRIAARVGSAGRAGTQPLVLTVLLDSSGSMEREDRRAGLKNAMTQLASLLHAEDRVTVVTFSRTPHLLADRISGAQAEKLRELAGRTPSEGGTNLEEALKLGGALARRQKQANAQNRIVLLTDGAANLGDADPEHLAKLIHDLRQQGIAFDAAGIGADGLNDRMLEQLTRNGNGRYYVINSPEDADDNFARQLAGAFRPAAENVKVQVRFNPDRVGRYKLLGFDQHRLRTEDFRNDKVDAAELAADEAGVALYQVETLPDGHGEVGEVSIRFRDVASGGMVERTWTIPYDEKAPAFDQAKPSMQLAALAALAAENLRGSELGKVVDFHTLAGPVALVRGNYQNNPRVADLVSMIEKLK